jgi:hypothetical protein
MLQRRDRILERGRCRHRFPAEAFAGCGRRTVACRQQVVPGTRLHLVHGSQVPRTDVTATAVTVLNEAILGKVCAPTV